MKKNKKIIFKFAIFFVIIIAVIFFMFLIQLPDVSMLKKSNPKLSAMMNQRIQEANKKNKKYKIKQKWVKINKIPKLLINSVVLTEDSSFYSHNGIDYYELKESIKKNFQSGKKARGGSTITQQLAKNLYLSTKKSYLRKINEFFIAKKLEKHLSKQRILEIYLNIIEFGRGIFGVEAASRHFFKKSVSELSLKEILRIVAVIPKPLRLSPLSNSSYMKWRVNLILKRLKNFKKINIETYNNLIFKKKIQVK